MKKPVKPRKPAKPKEPKKLINQTLTIKDLDKYTIYSLQELIESAEKFGIKDPASVEIYLDWSEDNYWGSENDCILRTNGEIKNPHYDYELKSYNRKLQEYQKKLDKYEEKMKQYRKDIRAYNKYIKEETIRWKREQLEKLKKELGEA